LQLRGHKGAIEKAAHEDHGGFWNCLYKGILKCLGYMARADTAGADLDAPYGSVVNGFNFLKVRVPGTPGLVVSMADVISEARPFAANFTYF
jgi:hypothetical protein